MASIWFYDRAKLGFPAVEGCCRKRYDSFVLKFKSGTIFKFSTREMSILSSAHAVKAAGRLAASAPPPSLERIFNI
jgi:hypothetical protein